MQLDPRQILTGLRKYWWIPLLAMLAAGAVAYVYENSKPRIYQAQATLVVRPVPLDNGMIEAIKKAMNSYAQELGSKQFWQQVIDANLIRDVDVDSLPGRIAIQPRPDENSILMTVDDTDPVRAAVLADRISRAFVERHNAENQNVNPGGFRIVWQVVQAPEVPSQPYQPRPRLYAFAGGLLGLILGLLMAAALELLDTSLKTPEDVRQFMGLNTLGVIPRS
jgi:uncharacterized protein involved in exopolysaccharide biosynthesis